MISEKIRSKEGVLGNKQPPTFTDNFGHSYYESPSQYLSSLVERKLGVRCRWEKPGTIQRSLMDSISSTDREEAYAIGLKAIEMSQFDMSEIILTIVRSEQPTYEYSIESAELKDVAGKTKYLPEEYRPDKQGNTSDLFKSYLQPLLGYPMYNLSLIHI